MVGVLWVFLCPSAARGQDDSPPVPPVIDTPEDLDGALPGFGSGEIPVQGDSTQPEAEKIRASEREGSVSGAGERTSVARRERADSRPRPDSNANDRLVELLRDTTGSVDLAEVVDEVLADAVAELDRFAVREVSPLSIRQVVVGSNLKPAFARELRHRITTLLRAGTRLKVVRCLECEATRSRVVGDQLVVTRGIVSTTQLRAVGQQLGVEAFVDVRFGFDPARSTIEFDFQLFRARDGEVLWAETYRADESTPMLMRASEAPQTREERLEDLQTLLEGRPMFGYAATAGVMLMPYNDPLEGDIFGATAGLRLFERFGTDRRIIFGLDVMGFVNFEILSGALVSAAGWWLPLEPDLVSPELRVGAKAGAFIAGNQGNTTVFQLGAELLLRYRFGLYAYATYVLEASYPGPMNNEQGKLGGLGTSAGLSFNW